MFRMTAEPGVGQVVFAGVDTHKDTHQVALVDENGAVLTGRQFPAGTAGYRELVGWLSGWAVGRVGIEQTGTYGAGLTRVLTTAGHEVVEVNRPDVWVRATSGKSDPIDAVMAAQAARTGRTQVIAKNTAGVIESVRLLHVARRSAVKARAAALVQLGDLAVTVPAGLRDQLGRTNPQIAAASRKLRADRDRLADPTQAAKLALRRLAGRIDALDAEIAELGKAMDALVAGVAPRLLALPQVGTQIAAQLMITAGQNIDRIGTEAKFARITGVAPIPASSGRTTRMRLHRGGDRQANRAIHLIAIGRLRAHQPAIDYLTKRTREGLSKSDAIRAMKRHIAREVYGALKTDLRALDGL
jgi:transposase